MPMSTTAVLVAGADGVLNEGRTFANSWGGAAFVWDALWREYLSPRPGDMPPTLDRHTAERVWDLSRDERLSVYERLVLVTTFDHCLIRRTDALRVAQALDAFVARYERRRGNRACNLPLQAMYLRELAFNAEVREIGWRQSAGDLWEVPVNETRPYNVQLDTAHWFLFDHYPELRGSETAVRIALLGSRRRV
jgi:hypothetical protein